jgi:rubrerythrin
MAHRAAAGYPRAAGQTLMSASLLIFAYVALLLAALCALTIYSEMRRRRFRPAVNEDRIFRCDKCGQVYTDDPDVDRSRCSQCGRLNEPIEF